MAVLKIRLRYSVYWFGTLLVLSTLTFFIADPIAILTIAMDIYRDAALAVF